MMMILKETSPNYFCEGRRFNPERLRAGQMASAGTNPRRARVVPYFFRDLFNFRHQCIFNGVVHLFALFLKEA